MKDKEGFYRPKTESGKMGEAFVVKLLTEKGFEVVKKNYSCRYGEIDIIAKNEKYIVFIEVKTRKPKALVTGTYSVGIAKQKKIIKTALTYLSENPIPLQPRFDVIELEYVKINPFTVSKINHIENAFILEEANAAF